ncbi:MAG: thioredoxin domain-containing protein [Candidatus Pacearchaeota archaeon]
MNTDGTEQKNLTNSLAFEYWPTISPDGKNIAFHSDRDGGSLQIYMMDIDGSNVVKLTSSNFININPSWSPNSSDIVFSSLDPKTNNYSIKIVNALNRCETTVLNNVGVFDCSPKWSPDGDKLVYVRSFYDESKHIRLKICLYDLKKKIDIALTNGEFSDNDPSFTPDGNKILFYSDRCSDKGSPWKTDIFQMNVDGTNIQRLTFHGNYINWPIMSKPTVFRKVDEQKLKQTYKWEQVPQINFPEVKENNLNDILNSTGVVIVDAYAVWCGPCKHYSKNAIEPASKKYPNVRFVKMDAEKNREISKQYDIIAYPTTLIFKNGKFVDKFIGADGGKLEEMIKKYSQ